MECSIILPLLSFGRDVCVRSSQTGIIVYSGQLIITYRDDENFPCLRRPRLLRFWSHRETISSAEWDRTTTMPPSVNPPAALIHSSNRWLGASVSDTQQTINCLKKLYHAPPHSYTYVRHVQYVQYVEGKKKRQDGTGLAIIPHPIWVRPSQLIVGITIWVVVSVESYRHQARAWAA